jgi:hypothetical protein
LHGAFEGESQTEAALYHLTVEFAILGNNADAFEMFV